MNKCKSIYIAKWKLWFGSDAITNIELLVFIPPPLSACGCCFECSVKIECEITVFSCLVVASCKLVVDQLITIQLQKSTVTLRRSRMKCGNSIAKPFSR